MQVLQPGRGIPTALLLASLLAAPPPGHAATSAKTPPPNIIFILADDLGYGDLGSYGSPLRLTPAIDRLAAEGARFTQFYAPTPYCAPARASLLTGRYPSRHGLLGNPTPDGTPAVDQLALAADEILLPQLLRPRGYATGMIGKWHLGHKTVESWPTRRGFDSYYGILYSNDMRPVQLIDQEKVAEYPVVQATLTQRYTQRALDFITAHRDRPFFLYLAHAMPHKPLAVTEKFAGKSGAGLYGDVLAELDWSVEQIMAKLRALGLDDRTLVVFTSDNGAYFGGSNGGLRGMKAMTAEGGLRVPCLARWPGRIPAGQTLATPAGLIDWFPTLLASAGRPLPGDRAIDGRTLWPVLAEKSTQLHEAIFGFQGTTLRTVRSDRWKLHVEASQPRAALKPGAPWVDPRAPDGVTILAPVGQAHPSQYPGLDTGDPLRAGALFDLATDPGEQHDVSAAHPEIVARLRGLRDAHLQDAAKARPLGAAAARPPNIVFILIDDMPWFGTPVRMSPDLPESAMAFRFMPNVERLAAQGMTFRNAYAAAGMCGPSRCSIQTGMMTARHLYSGNGGFGEKTNGTVQYLTRGQDAARPLLQPEPQGNLRFPSIGDVLKSVGYATAHFGKWHLYGGGPAKHGYDESDGDTDNKTSRPDNPPDDPKLMFSITQRSVDFIARQATAGRPFFLQVSHYATHARYQATKKTLAKYEDHPVFAKIENRRDRLNATLGAAMVEDLDTTIGQLLQKVDALGLAENTYVVFTTDNGYRTWNESYDPLRGAKWWLWENALRVPLIVRGPGIAAASRSTVNVIGYDFLPTFADLAGATAQLGPNLDGVSIKRFLLGGTPTAADINRPLYFHYPHYRVSPPASALIVGDTKLMHWYEWPDQRFVYDLRRDLGEKNNLAAANPARTAQLQQQLMGGLKAVGAYFPKPNPNADPKAKRYDPANLADQGEAGDPEATDSAATPAATKKSGKAKRTRE